MAVTFESVTGGLLNGISQLNDNTISQGDLFGQYFDANQYLQDKKYDLQYSYYLEKQHLDRIKGDPVLQDVLKQSYSKLQSDIQNSIDYAKTQAGGLEGDIANKQKWNSFFQNMGKLAGVGGAAYSSYQTFDAFTSGNDVELGKSVVTTIATGMAASLITASLASAAAVGTVSLLSLAAIVAAATIVVAVAIDTFLPAEVAEFIGDATHSIFETIWDLTPLDEFGDWLGRKIFDFVNTNFSASQVWQAPRDPLAFDLDGDGIETLAENGNAGVLFDHEGNDVKTATGWIAPDDGFLVYDRNGNGVIDNGTELFGDNTALNAGGTAANGFEALADFDTNADGVVDVNDANFAGLRIWQDINSDGISQADELLTLAQAGVASINTGYEDSSIAQNGNVISGLGSYTRTDGTLSSIASATSLVNLDLANSSFYSSFVDSIPVTAEAALLPTMNGSGMVRNMRAAA